MNDRPPQDPRPRRAPPPGRAEPAPRAAAALVVAFLLSGPPSHAVAPPPTLAVTGRLETPAGAAPGMAGGARIELLPAVVDGDAARRQLVGDPPAPPLAATRAAKDGTFTLQAPGPGCYRAVVSAEGYLPLELLLPLLEDQELPPARLTPATALALRAVGSQGEPLPGVLLSWRSTVLGMPAPARQGWEVAQRSGRTGVDGRLALPRGAGESLRVSTIDPRWRGELQLTDPAAAGTAGSALQPTRRRPADPAARPAGGQPPGAALETLRLTPQPPLVLEARAPGGQPIGGALLRLGNGWPIGIAGSDGRLEAPLAAAPGLPWTGAPTLEGQGGDLAAEVSWAQARGGGLRVSLTPVRLLDGRLTDGDGRALAGGLVWAERMDGNGGATVGIAAVAMSGQDGGFQLRWHPWSSIRLRAAAPGYLTAGVEAPSRGVPWAIRLQRAVALAGLVVDGAGRGVAGARVAVREAGFEGETGLRATAITTDPAGSFRLPALAAGRRYQLDVSASGFAPASVLARAYPRPATLAGPSLPPSRPPAAIVRIVLAPGGSIAGQIVDGAGQPLPGMPVTLVRADGIGGRLTQGQLRQWAAGDNSWQARSGAHGAFELPHLNSGRYRLLAGGPGFAVTERRGLELLPGAARLDLGRIVVEAGAAIEGRVSDPRGSPVPDAVVRFSPSPAGHPTSKPDLARGDVNAVSSGIDGRFSIPDLRRGQRYDLYVRHPEHAPASARGVAAPTAEALRIEVPDGGRLAGRVIEPGGKGVLGAAVSVATTPRQDFVSLAMDVGVPSVDTDAQGGFSISGLAPGTFDLTVKMDGYRPALLAGIQVSPLRDSAPLEIVLDSGSSLAGRVSDTAGHPARAAVVQAFPAVTSSGASWRGFFPSRAAADGEGRYLIEGLEAGPHTVTVERQRGAAPTIDLRPGPNQLDLVADPAREGTASVSGRLIDAASGEPLAGATVRLMGSRDASYSSTYNIQSLSDGTFIFSPLEPGTYELSAVARGYLPTVYPGSLDLSDAPVEGLELTLRRAEAAIAGRLSGVEPENLWEVHVGATAGGATDPPPFADGFLPAPVPAVLEDTGAYRIAGLAPGRWRVTAITDSGRSASGQVTLGPGVVEARLDLDLAEGFTVSGEVSLDERPVAGAEVALGAMGAPVWASRRAETAADGSFRLPNVKAGSYRLFVDLRTFTPITVPVELAADQEVPVDVSTGGLKGRVLAAGTGDPVGGATVIVEAIGDQLGLPRRQPAITGDDGAFEIAPLLAGHYRVTATGPGLEPAQATLEVPPHETAVATLELAARAAVH